MRNPNCNPATAPAQQLDNQTDKIHIKAQAEITSNNFFGRKAFCSILSKYAKAYLAYPLKDSQLEKTSIFLTGSAVCPWKPAVSA